MHYGIINQILYRDLNPYPLQFEIKLGENENFSISYIKNPLYQFANGPIAKLSSCCV